MPLVVSFRKLEKVLRELGFECIRQKVSHQRWVNKDGRKCTVPKHKEIAYGTFVSICEQARLEPNSTLKLM